MRSHCALYVDVGYLIAAAATRVAGTSLRSSVVISYPDLVTRLIARAEHESGMPLLRVNWYDSGHKPGGAPGSTQESIGMLPRVKLRLGRTSPQGEQKGVDLRIGLDLAAHGRNRVVDVIYLVSGDDDLTEAVEEAQGHGVQVILLAVPDAQGKPHGVSTHLIRESDGIIVLDAAIIDETVKVRQLQPDAPAEASAVAVAVGAVASSIKAPLPTPRAGTTATGGDRDAVTAATKTVPPMPHSPSAPSPAVLASSKPLARRPPQPAAGPVVWSSATGGVLPAGGALSSRHLDLIDEVCRGVITAWRTTATSADRERVIRERPYIPGDLDRTLLTDLSARLGIYEIDEHTRYVLRAQFWEAMADLSQ